MASADPTETRTRVEEILAGIPPHSGVGPTLTSLDGVAPREVVLPIVRRFCTDHPSPHVRFHADRVLRAAADTGPTADLPAPVTAEAVAAALLEPDPESRLAAARACRDLGREEANRLLRAAIARPEEDHWVLATLVAVLGEVGGEGAPEEASVLLDHPSPRVAANALQALHRLEPETALYAAHYRLDSSDNRVRAAAVLAISAADPDVAWTHVRDLATSPDVWMRASGCFLAATLDHPGAEDLLIRILRREEHPEIIQRALGWLATEGSAEALGAAGYWAMQGDAPVAAAGRAAADRIRARAGVDQEREDLEMGRFLRLRRADLDAPEPAEDPLLAELVRSALEGDTRPRRRAASSAPPPPSAAPPATSGPAAPPPAPAPAPAEDPERFVAETGEHQVVDTGDHLVPETGEAMAVDTAAGPAPPPPAPPPPEPSAAPRDDDPLAGALELLRRDRVEEAVETLQGLVPPQGGAVAARVRWALALAFLRRHDVGLALQHVEPLPLEELSLTEVYVLGLALEQAGAASTAIRLYEHVQSRRLGYRDVERRLGSLKGRRPDIPEDVWISLAARFEELTPLGRGGMGQVLAARERTSGRAVAVKVPDRRVLEDPRSRERFLRELETLATLEHPHVVRIYEVSRGEVPYYSMELVRGETLESLLTVRERMSAAEALRLLTPVAEALAYLHDRSIVHRDVKPSNILLDAAGTPRLSDFGIVYLGTRAGITSTGIMVGTMGYMAPEQLAGYPPTPGVDVYAFGVVLYRALTGRLPFETRNATLKLYRDPPPPSALVREVPREVEALALACLAREASGRPPDGGALLARARALQSSSSLRAVGTEGAP